MTVERQNYNTVPQRIWDNELGGFRAMTDEERRERSGGRKRRPRRDDEPEDDEQQDLQDYIEYVREHLDD